MEKYNFFGDLLDLNSVLYCVKELKDTKGEIRSGKSKDM
jgi:hypothetical protein